MGLINTQTIPLSDKLDAIAKAIGGLTESSAQQLEALSTTLSALLEQAKAKGATEASVLKQLEKLVTKAAELQEEVKQGKSSAALAVAAILKQLEEIKAKIGSTPTPPAEAVEYVDLGLPSGLKWATCNLGATKPEESGAYYAWGETEPKERYHWSTYKYAKAVTKADGSTIYRLIKYCADTDLGLYGFTDGKTQLEPADDAATHLLGAPWRMPTAAEVEELLARCTWTKETVNGIPCLRVTSKVNFKSIIISAAGDMTDTVNKGRGVVTAFWTSTLSPDESDRGAVLLERGEQAFSPYLSYTSRRRGLPIRPVRP